MFEIIVILFWKSLRNNSIITFSFLEYFFNIMDFGFNLMLSSWCNFSIRKEMKSFGSTNCSPLNKGFKIPIISLNIDGLIYIFSVLYIWYIEEEKAVAKGWVSILKLPNFFRKK